MILKERSGKLSLLGSPATLTTSSHCWRRRPISSPSAPCFTRTWSTARRQESSHTRFIRYAHRSPYQYQLFKSFLVVVTLTSPWQWWDLTVNLIRCFVRVVSAAGWRDLPGIPRVPRTPADLPHVVHRDGEFHRHRRRSLGLLSCVRALLKWHHPPLHAHPLP